MSVDERIFHHSSSSASLRLIRLLFCTPNLISPHPPSLSTPRSLIFPPHSSLFILPPQIRFTRLCSSFFSRRRASRYPTCRTRKSEFSEAAKPPPAKPFPLSSSARSQNLGFLSCSALRASRYSISRTHEVEFSEAAQPPPAKPFPLSPLSPFPQPRIIIFFCPSRLAVSYLSNSQKRVLRGGKAAPGEAFPFSTLTPYSSHHGPASFASFFRVFFAFRLENHRMGCILNTIPVAG